MKKNIWFRLVKSYSYILTKCVCVCPTPVAKGPKNGHRDPKLGGRPRFGVFCPHTDRDYAGRRPASIEYIIFFSSATGLGQLPSYTSWVGNSLTLSLTQSLPKKVDKVSQF